MTSLPPAAAAAVAINKQTTQRPTSDILHYLEMDLNCKIVKYNSIAINLQWIAASAIESWGRTHQIIGLHRTAAYGRDTLSDFVGPEGVVPTLSADKLRFCNCYF